MPPYPVTDLTGYLRGAWDLGRDIVADDGTGLGTFAGTARFTQEHGVLRYEERGELRLTDYRGTATRTLHYRPESPARCTVWFHDGHFFHDLQLDTGVWQVRHPCRSDMYYGYFEVLDPQRWRQYWRVVGPQKAYRMTTQFIRAAG